MKFTQLVEVSEISPVNDCDRVRKYKKLPKLHRATIYCNKCIQCLLQNHKKCKLYINI